MINNNFGIYNNNTRFYIQLYLEHLSEASFLYEQRLSLLDDPEITWKDIDEFEQRFEAHIDGLVVGEDLALEVCKQQATEGDFGELHAAIRVFCRQNRLNLIKEVVSSTDPEDKEKIKAIGDAFNDEFPEKWNNEIDELLKLPVMAKILPQMIGYRRLKFSNHLLDILQQNEIQNKPEIIRGLGRIRDEKIRVPLFNNYMQQEDEAVCCASALALLRIGEPKVVSYCQQIMQQQKWTHLLLGLSGNKYIVPPLLEIANSDKPDPDCLTALGLLGDTSAIDILLKHMTNKELAGSSAEALNLITGAGLYENVFVPEKIEEDELFEEEKEKIKAGEPLYPPGKEPGILINLLSQNPEDWINWWNSNKTKFNPKMRYRNGKPYSPAGLLDNLESEKSPRKIRELAYDELVIRYNIDFPFETDMPVINQYRAIDKYRNWVSENENNFRGQWYFAGKPQ